jgi:hypothetical protein
VLPTSVSNFGLIESDENHRYRGGRRAYKGGISQEDSATCSSERPVKVRLRKCRFPRNGKSDGIAFVGQRDRYTFCNHPRNDRFVSILPRDILDAEQRAR